ncbi:ankyrin repeat domain-containing protein 26-like [Eulemur rufifrons]|uniref:ankyrin repeat domain-containing protein 26-like n=1 Tax=Eulemur rufifrons TaxID=859984 RepID=UPI003744626A
MSTLGPGQNEDAESPQDLESISRNLTQNYGGDLCGSEVNKQKNTANGQVEAEEDLEVTSEDGQERHEENENNQPQVDEREKHKSNKMAVSENLYDGDADDSDDDALLPERKSRKTDSRQFPRMEKEECDRPTKQTSNEKNKVKEQIHSMGDRNDLTWSSEMAPEDYSASCLKIQDVALSCAREIELKNDLCERLTVKSKKMENMVRVLQEELCETKEIKSQLEHQKVVWEHELCSLRLTLKEEEEKRRNAAMSLENTQEELRRKEEKYRKEVEVKEQSEQALKTLNTEMSILRHCLCKFAQKYKTQRRLHQEQNAGLLQEGILARHHCKQETEMVLKKRNSEMSQSYEKEWDLLHQNCLLQEQTAMLRMQRDRIQMQIQEKEEKYFKTINIVQELYKNENLEMTVQQTGERIANTIPQYVGQLAFLISENAILTVQLENEKQNKERLQREVESCCSRLTTTLHDLDQTKASKRDLEFALERSRNEPIYLKEKMNFYVSNIKENMKILSQNLAKAENKIHRLENEFHYTRDGLAEKALVLKYVPRDPGQRECGTKEMKQSSGNEQGQVKKFIAEQESLEERLSPSESENMLLGQQLEGAENKANDKDKALRVETKVFH